MTEMNLYKYKGENGVIISPINLGVPCQNLKRLIADEGKVLTDGKHNAYVIDVEPSEEDKWREMNDEESK